MFDAFVGVVRGVRGIAWPTTRLLEGVLGTSASSARERLPRVVVPAMLSDDQDRVGGTRRVALPGQLVHSVVLVNVPIKEPCSACRTDCVLTLEFLVRALSRLLYRDCGRVERVVGP